VRNIDRMRVRMSIANPDDRSDKRVGQIDAVMAKGPIGTARFVRRTLSNPEHPPRPLRGGAVYTLSPPGEVASSTSILSADAEDCPRSEQGYVTWIRIRA